MVLNRTGLNSSDAQQGAANHMGSIMGRECLRHLRVIASRRIRIRDVVLMFSFVETISENEVF